MHTSLFLFVYQSIHPYFCLFIHTTLFLYETLVRSSYFYKTLTSLCLSLPTKNGRAFVLDCLFIHSVCSLIHTYFSVYACLSISPFDPVTMCQVVCLSVILFLQKIFLLCVCHSQQKNSRAFILVRLFIYLTINLYVHRFIHTYFCL